MISAQDVAAVMTDRCGAFLAAVEPLTGDAGTPSIDQALAWAVRVLGYPVATVLSATDSEVQAVADAQADALLDLTELRLLESIQTNLTAVTVKAGPVQADYNDLAARLGQIIPEKRANASARYGQWMAVPLSGSAPKRVTVRAV